MQQIKKTLYEQGQTEEFVKLEVLLRGNFLVKRKWRADLDNELNGIKAGSLQIKTDQLSIQSSSYYVKWIIII